MENSYISIKNWAADDRPREKMIKFGCQVLSNAELLAILIGTGTKRESAVDLAKRILQTLDNKVEELGKLTVEEFVSKFKGIGNAKAVTILAALELGKRQKIEQTSEIKSIRTSNNSFDIIWPFLSDLKHEEFWIILVNRACKVIDKQRIAQGNISAISVDIKTIIKLALDKTASGIILCHNHPSGNNKPGKEDIDLTKKIINAASFFDIKVLDHIILSGQTYFSFADSNYLDDNVLIDLKQ